jgi:type III pantothenate kinase
MNLVIDIGNTAAKIAVFKDNRIIEVVHDSKESLDRLFDISQKYKIDKAIVASVIELNEKIKGQLASLTFPLIFLDEHTSLPIVNKYRTPETLGYDRIAGAVGSMAQYPDRDILVIDSGTAITYDFINSKGEYLGGNISPGIQMRFKALHDFTDRLPLVKSEGQVLEYGVDTESAIRSGIMKGVEYEIRGYIENLYKENDKLLFFLTGGEKISFETSVKSIIFVDEFLVLKGLNIILNYNY